MKEHPCTQRVAKPSAKEKLKCEYCGEDIPKGKEYHFHDCGFKCSEKFALIWGGLPKIVTKKFTYRTNIFWRIWTRIKVLFRIEPDWRYMRNQAERPTFGPEDYGVFGWEEDNET